TVLLTPGGQQQGGAATGGHRYRAAGKISRVGDVWIQGQECCQGALLGQGQQPDPGSVTTLDNLGAVGEDAAHGIKGGEVGGAGGHGADVAAGAGPRLDIHGDTGLVVESLGLRHPQV